MAETLFDRVYADYRTKLGGTRSYSNKPTIVKPHILKDHWIKTVREMKSWRKTEEFQRWQRNQFLRQGGTCYYCDVPLKGIRQCVEHKTAKSLGGRNNKNNLVLACWKCNKQKGSRVLTSHERHELKVKNKSKKGTYHLIQHQYLSEIEFAYELAQKFR